MSPKKNIAVQPVISQAKKKSRGSVSELGQKHVGREFTMEVEESAQPETSFPIVGIGASAGELEALELLLANTPANSGMAFVIIQHLDPPHKGIMAELLQRVTSMPVLQVKDRTRIKPKCVYIIPPNKDMSILQNGETNDLV